jgi:hypothetical protein
MASHSTLQIGTDVVPVSSQLLFQRLIVAATGVSDDMGSIFSHELCPVPSALFDNAGCMREAQKASLGEAIWSLGDCSAEININEEMVYVLDGGYLLHKIPWPKGHTFKGICDLYVEYVRKQFGLATVVFDGYADGPTTKDVTHQRRSKGVMGTYVMFTKETPFRSKKEVFLANNSNKQAFINMLGEALQDRGISSVHATADADVIIVKTTIESASKKQTTLIGEDTDLLVLLCFYAQLDAKDIFFRSDKVQNRIKQPKIWNIKKTKLVLGIHICEILPAIHALTGCDTTSRMFGIGKGNVLKKVKVNKTLQQEFQNFQNSESQESVINVGEGLLVALYNGSAYETLNLLRLRLFADKAVNTLNTVQIHTLPPTSAAAKFHCLRAFLQVQQWTGDPYLDPTTWGWKVENKQYVPIRTDMPPAPAELLAIIRCKCKQNCDSKRCSCRKHGLECSVACKECKGSSCSNCSSEQPEQE